MADEQLRNNLGKLSRGERVGKPLGLLKQPESILTTLPTHQIAPDPNQPRKDLGDLSELKASIEQVGILQPILVTEVAEDRYQVLAGERRYTAARELGLEMVPVIVRSVEEQRRLEIQIIENLQRKDLNALEEAQSYRRLMEEHDYTQEEVAQRLGKDQTTISQTVRVLDLPLDIQSDYVTSHKVSKYLLLEVARAQREAQRRLWDRVKAGDIRTVAEARRARKVAPTKDGSAAELPQRPAAPVSLRYASPNQAVICSATFRDGNADERELLKVLQAWVRDLKKSFGETKGERTESRSKDAARHDHEGRAAAP